MFMAKSHCWFSFHFFCVCVLLIIGVFLTVDVSALRPTELSSMDYTDVFCGKRLPVFHPEPVASPYESMMTMDVSILGFSFMPTDLTIIVGDTVRWFNNDITSHNTTSDTGVWASNNFTNGQNFSFTFNSIGTFPYHCTRHPSMMGNINVVVPSPTPTYTATSTPTLTSTNTATATNTATSTPTPSGPPTLGNYPDTLVNLSGNALVIPEVPPTNDLSISVETSTNFVGELTADPITGVVRVTNAHHANIAPGSYTVTVKAFGPFGMATKTFLLTINNGTLCNGNPGFTPPTSPEIPVGAGPSSVSVGDFNGDGKQDLVVANANSPGVSILLGNGSGGFTPILPGISTGGRPISVAIGDFNGDGKQDFATANFNTNNVSIRLGDGSGGFTSPAAPEITVGSRPVAIAIGEFNGDGIQDLAVVNVNSNNVSIRLGDGNGGFTSPAVPQLAVGTAPQFLAIGDFNGDGIQDFAAVNYTTNNVSIRLGNGSGGFTSPLVPEIVVGSGPTSVVIGDFNGDGKQDLATANNAVGANNVSIRLGDGSGGFVSPAVPEVSVGSFPASVSIGDFNGDGVQDLAVANNSGTVSIRVGDGSGGFTPANVPEVSVGTSPRSVAIGDFNGDSTQDFVATNNQSNNVSIRLGSCVALTPTNTPTDTPTGSPSATQTNTSTATPTLTATSTLTSTSTNTPTSSPSACGTPGTLDPSFNGNGKVTTAIGSADDGAKMVIIQPDSKVVAAGYSANGSRNDFAVVRYNPDGTLDTSFNGTGKVTTQIGVNAEAESVAIQSDSKLIAAGYSHNGSFAEFAVIRYNADGTLDTSFNSTGIVTTDVGSGNDFGNSVAIQSDGKIVMGGSSRTSSRADFAVVRYNTDGTLDSSFNGTGKVITSIGTIADYPSSIAIQSDGKIVEAGYSSTEAGARFALVRYNTNGTLDTSFNGNGMVVTPIGSAFASSVAIQSDGKIVAAGTNVNQSFSSFAAARYNTNGSLDTSFNGNGTVITSVGFAADDAASSVAIQADGKIVTAGRSATNPQTLFAVVRYNANGTLDSSFNGTGKVTTSINGGVDSGNSVAIQSDGRLVVAGYSTIFNNEFALVRYFGEPCLTSTPTNTPTNTPTVTATDTPTPTPANTPSISGAVLYRGDVFPTKYISNVLVTGTGSPIVTTTTAPPGGTAGQYTLTGFGVGNYAVSLAKTTGQNSVTSNDAAQIAQHVAGTVAIATDPKKIAADTSGNGSISSNDAALIARFVAGLGAPIGNTNQWRFFVPNPTFPIGSSPTTRSYTDPIGNPTGEDYAGILIGEVSGNWTPSAARPDEKRRDTGDLRQETSGGGGAARGIAVELPEVTAEVGKEIVIPVKVEGIPHKGVISYEFDLRYDPTVIQPVGDAVDVKGTASRGLSVVTNANEPGLLRVVVYGAFPIGEDGVLLNLRFTAVGAAGSVSPMTFERIMFNEGEPRVSVVDGRVELF